MAVATVEGMKKKFVHKKLIFLCVDLSEKHLLTVILCIILLHHIDVIYIYVFKFKIDSSILFR